MKPKKQLSRKTLQLKPVYLWLATDSDGSSYAYVRRPKKFEGVFLGDSIPDNYLGQTWADDAWRVEIKRVGLKSKGG